MRNYTYLLLCLLLPLFAQAQFTPTEKGLTIIVTDGTDAGKNSIQAPPSDLVFQDTIRSLGMTDAIQAAAFLERPQYGLAGFILIFCVNDAIDGKQGTFVVDGEVKLGVYRLIRQKISLEEGIPAGMAPYRLSGMVYFLGIS